VTAASPWRDEAIDLVRGASGGLLFGIPLLYTMEMWWLGEHTTPQQSLVVLALTFLPVFLLNRTAGFRSTKDVRLADALKDTVEVVALAALLATGVLILLREIRVGTPLEVAVGKIAYESFPFALGISVARHFLSQSRTREDDEDGGEGDDSDSTVDATFADVGASLIGAAFVAFNIAPTDEIPMLHAQLGALGLVAIVVVSLVVSYAIVFVAGFTGQDERHAQEGMFQRPLTETAVSYMVALVSALLMLMLFQRASGPWHVTLGYVIVLGLPAAIGGAAGRVAV
jgi:putative integral membrane protein (TIGR02587 family)